MKMKNNVLYDAKKLGEKILKSRVFGGDLVVVNIALMKDRQFRPKGYKIPLSFGYRYEDTPYLLKKHRVIEAETIGLWFVNTTTIDSDWGWNRPDLVVNKDNISPIIQAKTGKKDWIVKYYYDFSSGKFGPDMKGQRAVLINKEKLKNFIKICNNLEPRINDTLKCLEYLDQEVEFKGKLERESLKLLIENRNKTVSLEKFFDIRNKYPEQRSRSRDSDKVELSNKIFQRMKTKIQGNKVLNEALTLKMSNGFSIIVNEKFIEKYIHNPTTAV